MKHIGILIHVSVIFGLKKGKDVIAVYVARVTFNLVYVQYMYNLIFQFKIDRPITIVPTMFILSSCMHVHCSSMKEQRSTCISYRSLSLEI